MNMENWKIYTESSLVPAYFTTENFLRVTEKVAAVGVTLGEKTKPAVLTAFNAASYVLPAAGVVLSNVATEENLKVVEKTAEIGKVLMNPVLLTANAVSAAINVLPSPGVVLANVVTEEHLKAVDKVIAVGGVTAHAVEAVATPSAPNVAATAAAVGYVCDAYNVARGIKKVSELKTNGQTITNPEVVSSFISVARSALIGIGGISNISPAGAGVAAKEKLEKVVSLAFGMNQATEQTAKMVDKCSNDNAQQPDILKTCKL